MFHVPLEERKYKDMNQFGEGEQAKICLEIMQRTGAHLELSLAKDQGLSIMVSGKLDAVMKARKDIVARLQTQVGIPSLIPLSGCAPAPVPRAAAGTVGLCHKLWQKVQSSEVGQQHLESRSIFSWKAPKSVTEGGHLLILLFE